MPGALSSAEISIVHRLDADISEREDHELRRLLLGGFPYETVLLTRRYIHEAPGHRWLAYTGAGELAAHAGVHDKVISVGGREVRIGGVAEVCVAHHFRGRGLVRRMLEEAHAWMQGEGIPFAMLFGQPRIYGSSGYVVIGNGIVAESSLVHLLNPFKGKPMVHPIGGERWLEGVVDLRGPTF
jgi:GNAT superfamily N-acetyltransferase